MKLSNFFRTALVVQLLVGTGLFSISLLIEYQVLQAFLLTPVIALFLALVLEVGKAAAIVWHRFLLSQSNAYPQSTRVASASFRIGLLLLSLLCSLLYLSNHLDRPNLNAVRAADLQDLDRRLNEDLSKLKESAATTVEALRRQYQADREARLQIHRQRLEALQQKLDTEMNNVVRGQFKGPRYRELERLLEKEREALSAASTAFAEKQGEQLARQIQTLEAKTAEQRKTLKKQAEQARKRIMHDPYADDERVNEPYIVAFTSLSRAMLPVEIAPMQFVFGFALLLSLLIEIGIMLAFDTVTVTLLPALKSQHQEELETELVKSRADATARQQSIRHSSQLDGIMRAYERTVAQAEKARDHKLAKADI